MSVVSLAAALCCLGASAAGAIQPPLDLRADAAGRQLLVRYLGSANVESFGDGSVRAYAPAAWRSEAKTAWRAAERVLPEISAAVGVAPQQVEPLWILVSPGGGGFEREAPSWSAAIAQPERRLIVLSGPALRQTAMNVEETTAHEIAHLAVHARLGELGWMPRWLDEGLAMRLSGYHRLSDRLASLGRGRIHLQELTDEFPRHPALARLAYLESEAAVRRLLERGPIGPLLDRLAAGDDFAPAFASVYGEPWTMFANRVYSEVASPWRWIATLGGGVTLGGTMAFLVVVGALRVRRRNRRRMRQWEEQEAALRLGPAPPQRPQSGPGERSEPGGADDRRHDA